MIGEGFRVFQVACATVSDVGKRWRIHEMFRRTVGFLSASLAV